MLGKLIEWEQDTAIVGDIDSLRQFLLQSRLPGGCPRGLSCVLPSFRRLSHFYCFLGLEVQNGCKVFHPRNEEGSPALKVVGGWRWGGVGDACGRMHGKRVGRGQRVCMLDK